MQKKAINRVLTFFLSAILMVCTACSVSTNIENSGGVKTFGNLESKDPLRICIDIQNFTADSISYQSVNEFLSEVKLMSGVEDVVIEYIPNSIAAPGITADNSIRATAIDRLRVEILSGDGPDVFIMSFHFYAGPDGYDLDGADVLFKYPQKAMENGLFLPLDDYIENKTKYAEWDTFPLAVMDAGRNAEGQQIIPITYTFPVLVYQQTDFIYTPNRQLSWNDMLTDPELALYAADLANSYDYEEDEDGNLHVSLQSYIEFILGEIADYETETLSFTEAELLQRVEEILALNREDTQAVSTNAEELFVGLNLSNNTYNQPFTLIPLYSDDGGITARIQNYAAVNRNTERPEDAYAAIDVLMSSRAQQNFSIYRDYLYSPYGLPMNGTLFQQDTPLQSSDKYLRSENYLELCEVRDQITNAHFEGEAGLILHLLFTKCVDPDMWDMTVEELVHEAYEDLQRRVRE